MLSLRKARWDGARWTSGGVVLLGAQAGQVQDVVDRCSSQDQQGPPLSGEGPRGAGLQGRWWVSQEGGHLGNARQHGAHLILKTMSSEFGLLCSSLSLVFKMGSLDLGISPEPQG